MKLLKLFVVSAMALNFSMAFADESTSEKVSDKARDTKREMKDKAHRAEEKMCDDSDAKCLKEKAEHRASEAKDATKDKTTEVKNKVD